MASEKFTKILTKTDVDVSGSHSNGISIPKRHAHVFGFFSEDDLNPTIQVTAVDAAGTEWQLAAYWYNDRVVSDGTRNEYRLAGEAKKMLRALAVTAGDTIELARRQDGKFAISVVGHAGSDSGDYLSQNPEAVPEGAAIQVTVNRYERSVRNRESCIARHGVSCACCGMSFAEAYGRSELNSLINAHHLTPVSQLDGSPVDPTTDMVPVCPNCHAVIHSSRPDPLTIQEVRELRASAGNQNKRSP